MRDIVGYVRSIVDPGSGRWLAGLQRVTGSRVGVQCDEDVN